MRAEVRARALRIAALAFTALAAFAHDVRAQYVTGYLKGQFQVFEDQALVPNGDGTFRTDWKRTERWTQTIELQHVAQPRSDLRVMSNFRYTDLSYSKLPDASRSPQGSVQVTHPWASLFAAYRPSTVTGGLGATGVSAGDSARAGAITARSQETMLLGQIAPPNLPRLDVSWNRRHRNADVLSPEEAGVNRNARLSWTRGALSSYASLGDQSIDHPAQNTRGTTQRTGGAGAALHLTPTRQTAMDLQYDFADARSGNATLTAGSSRSHNASFNGTLQQRADMAWNANWMFRRSQARGPRTTTLDDHEAALNWSFDPRGPLRLLAAGGTRTARTVAGSGLSEYASAVASLDGDVRPGWRGTATASHVTNWDPGHGTYSVDAGRIGSRLRLARGLEANVDASVTANGDTGVRDSRVVSDASGRLRATPLRSLNVGLSARIYRSGPTLADGNSRARSILWDVRWRVVPTLELTGSSSITGVLPNDRPRNTTRLAGARWNPFARVQLAADWSKSDQSRTDSSAQPVSGREIASAHLLALLSRSLQLDASGSIADRGTARENRQMNVSLTWALGR